MSDEAKFFVAFSGILSVIGILLLIGINGKHIHEEKMTKLYVEHGYQQTVVLGTAEMPWTKIPADTLK